MSSPQITMRDRMGRNFDDMLSPDDNIFFRCVDCTVFFLPREIPYLRARVKDAFGRWTWDIVEMCPVCEKNGTLLTMDRAKYHETVMYERAGLIPAEGLIIH